MGTNVVLDSTLRSEFMDSSATLVPIKGIQAAASTAGLNSIFTDYHGMENGIRRSRIITACIPTVVIYPHGKVSAATCTFIMS